MRLQKILSLVLVVLMLTSVTVGPATASASASGFAPAAAAAFVVPELTQMVINGVTIIMSGTVAVCIAALLGHYFEDQTQAGWDKLIKDTGQELTKMLPLGAKEPQKWRTVSDDKTAAILLEKRASAQSGGGSGPKKDDKWYFIARTNHGKLEIDTNHQLNEEEAVKEMKRGKDILTVSKELAQNVVGRFEGLPKEQFGKLQFEKSTARPSVEEWYEHLHYDAKGMRLHCWVWEP